jgi:hypothetical protein
MKVIDHTLTPPVLAETLLINQAQQEKDTAHPIVLDLQVKVPK